MPLRHTRPALLLLASLAAFQTSWCQDGSEARPAAQPGHQLLIHDLVLIVVLQVLLVEVLLLIFFQC